MTDPRGTWLDTELELASLASARFTWSGGDYRGAPALSPDLAERLLELETLPEDYGLALYDAVFPRASELREGLREAILAAEREKSRLRFRLHLSLDLPDWVHGLYWELLADPDRHLALSRSPDTAFSRYLDARRSQGAPAPGRPRVLCVISAPSDITRHGMAEIRRDEVRRSLETALEPLAGAIELAFLEPPATLERLRERLMEKGGFQLLHFFGHGLSFGGVSALVLEDAQGRIHRVEEKLLAEVFLGVRELRLVTLVACHGGAPSSGDPFSGLAGRLVHRGVPSVIAMRRAVRVESAHLFTRHLYQQIAQTGRADAAVNEARQQLYLAAPSEIDWSSPVLYSRLSDGRLWLPQGVAEEPEENPRRVRQAWHRLRRPLPWVPAFLALALGGLGFWPAPEAEVRFDLQVSQLFFRLAESATVIERLDLAELAATRLAAVRLPDVVPVEPGRGEPQGVLVTVRGAEARLALQTPPLPPGTGFGLEHQGESSYLVTVTDSEQPLSPVFQGDVMVKPLPGTAAHLRLDRPSALDLLPRDGALKLDVAFARFTADSFAADVAIDALDLFRVIDQQTAEVSMVRKESTVLTGDVEVPATGQTTRLEKGEGLRFTGLSGALTGLHLGPEGLRFGFQGRVRRLERLSPGMAPEALMPAVLDLWIPRPARLPVLGACGLLAVAVLLLAALDISFFRERTLQ